MRASPLDSGLIGDTDSGEMVAGTDAGGGRPIPVSGSGDTPGAIGLIGTPPDSG